jgi:PAS domain S-box-containing protein
VDGGGVVAYLNPAAEQVLGMRAERAQGHSLERALPERLAPLRELVRSTLRECAPRARAEVLVRTESGTSLPLGASTNLLKHNGDVTGVVTVFQDLTEARAMERRVRRNETLAEVGALAAGIAHELRNGLNPISGSVEYLQRELKLEGESAVLMDLIGVECGRLNRFVTDLLAYSRERDLALGSVDLGEELGELCDGLRRDPRCPGSVSVMAEAPGRPCPVEGDREQLRQVWLNLAYNAFEAMSAGGTLRVRWLEVEGARASVEFVDSGPGIAAADLPHLGQPFFTTKEGGTGLGVAIAQRIVERHGGTLQYESAPGRGTVARVILPVGSHRLAQAA